MSGRVIQASSTGRQLMPLPDPWSSQVRRGGTAVQPSGSPGNFTVDPLRLGLFGSPGRPLARALLAKMEAAFGADFSAVRVHVGDQPARIGAVAFTNGNDLYFAPGRFQPDSAQGQRLLGHELAHVIQQRQGRVNARGAGVTVVQDRAFEAEADRLGEKAAAFLAGAPLRPGQANRAMPTRPPALATVQMMRRGPPQDQKERVDALRARLRAKLDARQLAPATSYPKIERPNKPHSLSARHPVTRQPLTFHHKLNAEKILEALRDAIATKDLGLLEKLVVFSGQKMPSGAFISQLFKEAPLTVGFDKQFRDFLKKLVWTPWNGFFGDVPENRLDDPKHDIDSHVTASGSQTPRTRLAHDVGANFRLDVKELRRRLRALQSTGASPYREAEWGKSAGLVFQTGDTKPAVRVVLPHLKAPVARNNVSLMIASNTATTNLTVHLGGDLGVMLPVVRAGTHWSAQLPDLAPGQHYVLTITAQGADGQTTVITPNFTSSSTLTQTEMDALVTARQNRGNVEVDLSDVGGFWD